MKEAAIICVDDEEFVLRSLKRELYDALGDAYFIETATGAEDALNVVAEMIAENYEIPLVITDHIMLDMKGDELLRRIHALAPKTLKIMLTGQADMQAVTNAVNQANLYRYIAKPWERTDFILTVKEAIHTYFQEKKLEEQHRELQQLYRQAQQEITERKRVEAALREREARIRAILETAADGILTIDDDGLIQSFNSAAEQMFGYAASAITGQTVTRILPSHPHIEYVLAEEREQQAEIRQKRQGSIHCEITALRQNGDVFPVDLSMSVVLLGTQRFFIDIVRDITERKQAEQERLQLSAIQQELTIAHDIQQSLLPPLRPEWPELDVVCYNAPAREVGGDFYDYHAFPIQANPGRSKFAISIGDVSGKGVSAALLMATVLAQFDAALTMAFTPAERLAYLDSVIAPYTSQRYQNCALTYVEFECLVEKRSIVCPHPARQVLLRAVNAGGIPPFIKRCDGRIESLDIRGLPLGLGLEIETRYQEVETCVHPGDMVLLISDGVVEATDCRKDMFGFERLEAELAVAPMADAQSMLEHLNTCIASFVQGAEPYDDVTIVVIKI